MSRTHFFFSLEMLLRWTGLPALGIVTRFRDNLLIRLPTMVLPMTVACLDFRSHYGCGAAGDFHPFPLQPSVPFKKDLTGTMLSKHIFFEMSSFNCAAALFSPFAPPGIFYGVFCPVESLKNVTEAVLSLSFRFIDSMKDFS